MRILFVGAVEFSLQCLHTVLDSGGDVVGVVTGLEEGAHFNADFADLGPIAATYEIPLHRTNKVRDPGTVEFAARVRPDVVFVFGFSQLLPGEFLEVPRLGAIGSHPSMLPQHRGRHPLIWSLINGLNKSGLTFFFLNEDADSGDILWQREFQIDITDDARSLYDKIKNLATAGIREFLPALENGTFTRTPQDHGRATYWPKRSKADGEIDWSRSSMECYNLIRALTSPYPGAHTYLGDTEIKVWKAYPPIRDTGSEDTFDEARPGEVLAFENSGLLVRCGDGVLRLENLEGLREGLLKSGHVLGRRVSQA